MLQSLSVAVQNCISRAEACAKRARESEHGSDKEFWLCQETTWGHLAESYQFSERLQTVLDCVEKPDQCRPELPTER